MVKESRITLQKRILEKELLKFKTFFTADELFEVVIKEDLRVGIATVYRFLKSKVKTDEIHSYYCDRRQVFSTHDNSHCHFMCTNCGKTTHIKVKDLDFIKKGIDGKVCHFQIDIHGICKDCQKT